MEIKRSHNIGGLSTGLGVSDSKKADESKHANRENVNDAASKKKVGVNVNISESALKRSEEIKKAYEIAQNTSPIRQDRVDEIKKKIADGTYEINSGRIADGLLMEATKDELSTGL